MKNGHVLITDMVVFRLKGVYTQSGQVSGSITYPHKVTRHTAAVPF